MARRDKLTLFSRIQSVVDRYRKHGLISIAVTATLLLLASEFIPEIDAFLAQHNVLSIITLLVVIDVAVAFEVFRDRQSKSLMENQDESFEELVPLVEQCSGADLLEYAASTTLPLIRAVRRRKVPMRLLVAHPDNLSGMQRDRCVTVLDTIYNSIFEDYDGEFEVRCYRLPYSLRGRLLKHQALELGWLTPDYKRNTAYGHVNPSNLIRLPNTTYDFLLAFFERTFEDYWTHPDTTPGKKVFDQLQAKQKSTES